jgi:hypothetical protein
VLTTSVALAVVLVANFGWFGGGNEHADVAIKDKIVLPSDGIEPAESPDWLLAQMTQSVPHIASVPSHLARIPKPRLNPSELRTGWPNPTDSVLSIGMEIPGKVQPIRETVTNAFAFLNDLKPGDKRSL